MSEMRGREDEDANEGEEVEEEENREGKEKMQVADQSLPASTSTAP